MAWIYLGIASLFEIVFALSSSAAQGYTRLWPSVINILAAIGGVYLLSLALLTLDVGIAYTVWTGIGAFGSVIFGRWLFKETVNGKKLLSLLAIVLGVAGLYLLP